MFDSRAERGGMRVFSPKGASVILLVGALVVVGSLQLGRPTGHVVSDPMSFWEAAGRGPMTATVVKETYLRDGTTVTSPVRVHPQNAGDGPAAPFEAGVRQSPHPPENPSPDPLRT